MLTDEELREAVRRCRGVIAGEIALLSKWLGDASLSTARRAQVRFALSLTDEGVGSPRWRGDHVDLLIDALPPDAAVEPIPPEARDLVENCEMLLRRRRALDATRLPPATFRLAALGAHHNAAHAAQMAEALYSDALAMVE